MNRFFYGFIAFLFLFLSIYPFSNVFADNDLVITGTPSPVQGDITDEDLKDMIVAGITADLISQGYSIDLSASDGDWDNFKNAILDYIFDQAASGSGFIGEIYNSALQHNIIDEEFTLWYPDSDSTYLPGISKRSIYRNLSDGLVNNILEHRSDDNSNPSPSPDINYLPYLDEINKHDCQENSQRYFWFYNAPAYNTAGDHNTIINPYVPTTNYSWVLNTGSTFYNYSYQSGGCIAFPIISLYIVSNNDTYSFSFSGTGNSPAIEFSNYNYSSFGARPYAQRWNISATCNYSYSGTLQNTLEYICYYFRNVNIYVDGVPWSIVSQETLPTINIYPGYVLQGTDYPMQYYFPEPPQFDYQRMIDIIKHALLQYGVIQWEDIADVFVDVNGQTAVAVLEMHRNDYDVLYDEQYPGIALPNRFNTHLLDTSHQYLSPVVQTVEETTGVLPGEIKGALAIGMMLTIFACLIHRLLE